FAPRIDTAELDVIGRDIKDSLARSSDRTIQAGIVVRLREVQQDSIGAVRDFEVVAAEVVVYFGGKRTLISEKAEPGFRFMPNTDFGRRRTLVSGMPNTHFG